MVVPPGALQPLGAVRWPRLPWGVNGPQPEPARHAHARRLPGRGRAQAHPVSGAVWVHAPVAGRWGAGGSPGVRWLQAEARCRVRCGGGPGGRVGRQVALAQSRPARRCLPWARLGVGGGPGGVRHGVSGGPAARPKGLQSGLGHRVAQARRRWGVLGECGRAACARRVVWPGGAAWVGAGGCAAEVAVAQAGSRPPDPGGGGEVLPGGRGWWWRGPAGWQGERRVGQGVQERPGASPAPNKRLQPTPSSARSCVASASGRG
jgi:hypothetical protein